jgi:hypothetical protein
MVGGGGIKTTEPLSGCQSGKIPSNGGMNKSSKSLYCRSVKQGPHWWGEVAVWECQPQAATVARFQITGEGTTPLNYRTRVCRLDSPLQEGISNIKRTEPSRVSLVIPVVYLLPLVDPDNHGFPYPPRKSS